MKENTHIVIKREDANRYLSYSEYETLERLLLKIQRGRSSEGKTPENNYYICNTDEPYAEEVLAIIQQNEQKMKM